jgi:hypothetical protein
LPIWRCRIGMPSNPEVAYASRQVDDSGDYRMGMAKVG